MFVGDLNKGPEGPTIFCILPVGKARLAHGGTSEIRVRQRVCPNHPKRTERVQFVSPFGSRGLARVPPDIIRCSIAKLLEIFQRAHWRLVEVTVQYGRVVELGRLPHS